MASAPDIGGHRPFYADFAWAYDDIVQRPVARECKGIIALLARRGVFAPANVLDAGCGTGRYAVELATRGFSVTGLDLSAQLIEQARRRERAGASFLVGDLLTFSATTPYDAVLCRGVLNDLIEDRDRSGAFVAFARVLRPGGVLVCDARDWYETARRKAQGPAFERCVETPRGTLTFRSITHLDHAGHRLLIDESHELRTPGRAVKKVSYGFTMRCWTRDELDQHLLEASFDAREYFCSYQQANWQRKSDRIIALASRPWCAIR